MAAAAPTGEAEAEAAAPSVRKARLSYFLRYLVVVVLVGGIVGIVWALVPSTSKKVNIAAGVEAASLTRFALNSNSSLEYALALNLTLTNNGRYDIYYKKLEAGASYGGEEFASVALPSFSQSSRSNSTVSARFQGQTRMTGGPQVAVAEKLGREKGKGYYHIDVKVDLHLRTRKYDARKARVTSRMFFAKVACSLQLPLASVNGSTPMGFKRTDCDVKFS